MKALAWDDKPQEYFDDLKVHLSTIGIAMTIEKDANKVAARLANEQWDLIITDILDDSRIMQEGEPLGVWIAKQAIAGDVPLYIITTEPDNLHLRHLRGEVPIFPKTTLPGFVAFEIKRDLKKRGAWINENKVFVIYGHDRESGEASKHLKAELVEWGVKIGKISGDTSSESIDKDLLTEMQDSVAIIAVCTPDDEILQSKSKRHFQPRPNVLLEIGMAMGLNRGLRKLTILQRWGKETNLQAVLPSDLGGVLTFRFSNGIDATYPKLQDRLKKLGVALSDK